MGPGLQTRLYGIQFLSSFLSVTAPSPLRVPFLAFWLEIWGFGLQGFTPPMPGLRPGWNGEKNKREMTNRNFPPEIPRFTFHRERFFFPWGFRCLPGCWYCCDPQLWDWGLPRGRAGRGIFFFLNHGISSTLSPKGPFPWPVIIIQRVSSEAFSVHTCYAVLGFGLPESRLEK